MIPTRWYLEFLSNTIPNDEKTWLCHHPIFSTTFHTIVPTLVANCTWYVEGMLSQSLPRLLVLSFGPSFGLNGCLKNNSFWCKHCLRIFWVDLVAVCFRAASYSFGTRWSKKLMELFIFCCFCLFVGPIWRLTTVTQIAE